MPKIAGRAVAALCIALSLGGVVAAGMDTVGTLKMTWPVADRPAEQGRTGKAPAKKPVIKRTTEKGAWMKSSFSLRWITSHIGPPGAAGRLFQASRSGGVWVFPRTLLQPKNGVTFYWTIGSSVPADVIAKVLKEGQCCMRLRYQHLTGVWLEPDVYPQNRHVLGNELQTTIDLPYAGPNGGWPVQIQLSIHYQQHEYHSDLVTIQTGPVLYYFTELLYPTFMHPRCSNCHSMGDISSLGSTHSFAKDLVEAMTCLNNQTLQCGGGCHSGIVNEWTAPAFAKGIDWLAINNAKQVCDIVVQHLPTAEALRHHFFEDARVVWAVTSGEVPGKPSLQRAPPFFWAGWQAIINEWIDEGIHCPNF